MPGQDKSNSGTRYVPGRFEWTRWPYTWFFPELTTLRTPGERRQAFKFVKAKLMTYRKAVFARLAFMYACMGLGLWLVLTGAFTRDLTLGLFVAALTVVIVASNPAICLLLGRKDVHRLLQDRIADEGFMTCSKCDYSLRGNRSGRCPECGTPIPPEYRGATPRTSRTE
jgi:hypothetical protein